MRGGVPCRAQGRSRGTVPVDRGAADHSRARASPRARPTLHAGHPSDRPDWADRTEWVDRTDWADKTVLVYLQSDGQPVDPTRWEQEDPYEPVLKAESSSGGSVEEIPWDRLYSPREGNWRDWRIFARSASDSKGPNVQFLTALDAMRAAEVEPAFNLKVIFFSPYCSARHGSCPRGIN